LVWFKSGYYLYNKQDSFGSKYLVQSKIFRNTVVKPLFSLVFFNIRTFAPIVAGIVSMDKQKFMFYNILSSFIWSFTLILQGIIWLLLENYQIDLKTSELIVIALVAITVLPVIYKFSKI
jgi:membrane-associated protein